MGLAGPSPKGLVLGSIGALRERFHAAGCAYSSELPAGEVKQSAHSVGMPININPAGHPVGLARISLEPT